MTCGGESAHAGRAGGASQAAAGQGNSTRRTRNRGLRAAEGALPLLPRPTQQTGARCTTPSGGVELALLADSPNVQVVNDFPSHHIQHVLEDALRHKVPEKFGEILNDLLQVELPPALSQDCDPADPGAGAGCFTTANTLLQFGCDAGTEEDCLAVQALESRNFVCLPTGKCGFHPVVQGVNVLPNDIELVFAPDPNRPDAPLQDLARLAPSLLGVHADLCTDYSRDPIIDGNVSGLEEGHLTTNNPPIACATLGL